MAIYKCLSSITEKQDLTACQRNANEVSRFGGSWHFSGQVKCVSRVSRATFGWKWHLHFPLGKEYFTCCFLSKEKFKKLLRLTFLSNCLNGYLRLGRYLRTNIFISVNVDIKREIKKKLQNIRFTFCMELFASIINSINDNRMNILSNTENIRVVSNSN